MTEQKKEKIRKSIKETKQRRTRQIVKVAELKLQKIKRTKKEKLHRVFLEAKWYYNWLLSDLKRRLCDPNTDKVKEVEIKVKDHFEVRELLLLSSQMKQGIKERIRDALKELNIARKNGREVGTLKFKSDFSSIPLKQPGCTFKFCNDKKTRVRIQNLGVFRVLGGHAIPEEAEIAKAYLLKRPDGFFLILTYYIFPEAELSLKKHKEHFDRIVGLDLGIKDQVSLSNGFKISWQAGETERIKQLQRELTKIPRGSKRYRVLRSRLRREYRRVRKIRKDIENKVISLLKRYKAVCFQDDGVKAWHQGWFGVQVQHSALGGITARLKGLRKQPATLRVEVVPKGLPTTKTCFRCGARREISLDERIFQCPKCGLGIDRDLNAALNMVRLVGLDRPEGLTPMPSEEEKRILKRLFDPLSHWVRVSYAQPPKESCAL